MKKIILFAAILFAGVSVMKAQEGITTNAVAEKEQSTLTVRLKPYQNILVTGDAEIVFASKDDYEAAEKKQTTGNVKVSISSAGGFTVSVYAADLKLGSTENTIAASQIKVSATATANSLANTINTDVILQNTAIPLIESASGKIATSYDLVFKAIDGEVYRKAFDSNGSNTEEQVYTTTVFYEIAAK